MNVKRRGKSLGWASIGIGLTELGAPKTVEKLLGISNSENTGILRVLGAREVMHGVDILCHGDAGPGMYARVAGDLLDSALLGCVAKRTQNPKAFGMVCAMVLGIGVLDILCAREHLHHG